MSTAETEQHMAGLKEILLNREKGAAELLRDAINFMDENQDLLSVRNGDATLRALRRTRPAMAGFSVLARRIENEWRRDPGQASSNILQLMRERVAEADRKVAKRLHRLLVDRQPVTLVTMSYSTTVRFALEHAAAMIDKVYVLKSDPGGEGALLADDLRPSIKSVELLPDDALAEAVHLADFGVFGADTIFTDGMVLNKVLSLRLAEALQASGKDLFVVASGWKMAGHRSTDQQASEADRFEEVPGSLVTRVISDA